MTRAEREVAIAEICRLLAEESKQDLPLLRPAQRAFMRCAKLFDPPIPYPDPDEQPSNETST